MEIKTDGNRGSPEPDVQVLANSRRKFLQIGGTSVVGFGIAGLIPSQVRASGPYEYHIYGRDPNGGYLQSASQTLADRLPGATFEMALGNPIGADAEAIFSRCQGALPTGSSVSPLSPLLVLEIEIGGPLQACKCECKCNVSSTCGGGGGGGGT